MTSPLAIIRPSSILTPKNTWRSLLNMNYLSGRGQPWDLRALVPSSSIMANNVLAGYVTRICEIYIDDVLIHGSTDDEYVDNTSNCQELYFLEDTSTPVLPSEASGRLKKVHNSLVDIGTRLNKEQPRQGERDITDRMIKKFIPQCPACQVMNRMRVQIKTHRFTCATYNPLEVFHLGSDRC